ncbi:peptidyl-dipeptidase activity protein [Homalodisca vitripennis]|nr:peptidyl-dipeptidase activity protein [Homalodisca vitripennis]
MTKGLDHTNEETDSVCSLLSLQTQTGCRESHIVACGWFHEAISEAVSLSVTTPHHLQTLGLVLRSVDDIPHNINFLFSMALDKVAFLPFALALDFWRWDIFQGNTPRDRYNCHWWDLRERLSGIKPPVLRSETDFDPGSKYHVPANIPYIRTAKDTVPLCTSGVYEILSSCGCVYSGENKILNMSTIAYNALFPVLHKPAYAYVRCSPNMTIRLLRYEFPLSRRYPNAWRVTGPPARHLS